MTFKTSLRETFFRIWYWYVNKADKNAQILFMNFGYHDPSQPIAMDDKSERDRYSIQLYHQLADAIDMQGKDIVEIGCGRGGGLSYIAKNFLPATALGIDLNKQAVRFCSRHYSKNGLSFIRGDAQKLDLADDSCDIVINVESSHRYPNMTAFLKEVFRILRPGGFFLFTDFRYDSEMDEMKKDLNGSRFTVVKEKNINREVTAALELDDSRRRTLIYTLAPKFLHNIALNFAGAVDSDTFNNFASNKYVYFSYVFKK
ncbi:MAG TPA: class I SAM-dependent methyltransferase [Bacteroidales bacterium]|nr:class I SAM-dependent methyltransferase [Bacteroidales bacterium]HPJ55815.1 class I SAM-dependent methyltransferase [Bacteroidales bacterium]HPQ56780.1 class I SAM-dependent methyltransferase [Bacteroidales bacterium]